MSERKKTKHSLMVDGRGERIGRVLALGKLNASWDLTVNLKFKSITKVWE